MNDTETDRAIFFEAFGKLALATGTKAPDTPKMVVYFERLSDVPLPYIVRALDELSKESTGIPSVAKIREMVDALLDFKLVQEEAQPRQKQITAGWVLTDTGWEFLEYCPDCHDKGWIIEHCPGDGSCQIKSCRTVSNSFDENRRGHQYAVRCRRPLPSLGGQCCFPNNPKAYEDLVQKASKKRYGRKLTGDRRS